MRDAERLRVQRHFYPRPPEEVIDTCILWAFRKPEDQEWILGIGLDAERPRQFRCGHHRPTRRDPGPVEVVDLPGMDGRTYRVGQCPRCGRIFWGVKGERPNTGRREG
jgi:hypothetical protein